MKNSKGDKGSSCLKPREIMKKVEGGPFTKTEMRTEEIQYAIQFHFSPKPHLFIKHSKNSQFT
jgi:hypothetical protein